VPQTIQRSFTSGEIAPALQSRADLTKYATGLNLCENFFVRAQGGVYSRPGFSFRGELDDSSKVGRLIPFSFSTEQTYILVFEDLKMRVMKDGGYLLKSSSITGVTQANPAVVTADNTFINGETVTITGVVGMTELNGNTYTVANRTDTTFELSGTDSTAYTAYVSGGVAQGGTIFELTTPYTEAQLPRLGYTQSADVLTLVHPSHDPSNLNRLFDGHWTLTTINYASTVTAPTFASPDIETITGITQANPAVVTTSAAHGFVTGNVIDIAGVVGMTEVNGRSFRITVLTSTTFELDGEDSTTHTAYSSGGTATRQTAAVTVGSGFGDFEKTYTYVVTAVNESGIESLASVSASVITKSLSVTGGVRITWDAVAGAAYYRIYKDPSNNTQVYGWIGDSNNNTFDDYNIAPIITDAPPEDRQPFNGADNKPAVVTYYQQRQVFANTNNELQATYTTQVNNFNSLRVSNPARDSDAVTFTIAAQQVNEIRHLISLDSLVLLTSGGEWLVSEGQDRVLTPSTIGVRPQSYNGASWVKPVVINSTALYLQSKGARIRDLGYEFSSDKYTGNDLSIMSEHLFEGHQIIEMTYADEPYGILWCVRDDGVLLGLTYLREHQVWGWHQHNTDGEFESITTINEEGRDAVYVIVKRTINGQIKRYIERLEARESINAEDAFYVDSGLSYNGSPATVFSGLDHLEGKEVAILTDGYVTENQTVASGSITLTREASKVHIGLPYTPAIELLGIDTASNDQSVKAKSVSVSKVHIEVEGTRGGFVGPRQDPTSDQPVTFQEIKPRFDADDYDAIALKTYKQEVSIDPLWGKSGGVRIEQRSPLPMAILSVIPTVDLGGS